jgi:hypothetical protein
MSQRKVLGVLLEERRPGALAQCQPLVEEVEELSDQRQEAQLGEKLEVRQDSADQGTELPPRQEFLV